MTNKMQDIKQRIETIKAMAKCIQNEAFKIPSPNEYTPCIVQYASGVEHIAREIEQAITPSDDLKRLAEETARGLSQPETYWDNSVCPPVLRSKLGWGKAEAENADKILQALNRAAMAVQDGIVLPHPPEGWDYCELKCLGTRRSPWEVWLYGGKNRTVYGKDGSIEKAASIAISKIAAAPKPEDAE